MAQQRKLVLPFRYTPREYQQPVWDAMAAGIRKFLLVWHRRSGKDKTAWNMMIQQAATVRPGIYYYFFPTYSQGKKVLWDGIDKDGFRLRDHVPTDLLLSKPHETEMKLTLRSVGGAQSIVQVIGTDNFDSIMGTNPVGTVWSEYSLQNPKAFDYVRPILRENDGWAMFAYTPRGRNHGFRLWDRITREKSAGRAAEWFTSLLTVRHTRKPDGSPVISDADIEEERREGMDEETLQQEYYCSFSGAMQGAYYAKQIEIAYKDGRISDKVMFDPSLPVETSWDIGVGDSTALWFTQSYGNEVRFIDCYAASGEGLNHYIQEMQQRQQTLKYLYTARHLAPHDIQVREFTTGISRKDAAAKLGLRFRVVPKLEISDGIDAARRLFPRCWFNETKCEEGLNALVNYRKEYDDKRQEFKREPLHDWSSHYADAFRVKAVGHRQGRQDESRLPLVLTAFDPYNHDRRAPAQAVTDFEVF